MVWPGVTAFPDWFASGTQDFWNNQFLSFFDSTNGIDIDGLWIDMNKASNFCPYPCSDPEDYAISAEDPPQPPSIRPTNPQPLPGWPDDFQASCEVLVQFLIDVATVPGQSMLVTGNVIALGKSTLVTLSPILYYKISLS